MPFHNEKQLRTLWRENMGVRQYFVEPNIGSTLGLPDVFGLKNGVMFGAELKKGERSGGRLKYHVRDSQRRTIPDLINDGANVVIAVAEIGTHIVHVFDLDLGCGDDILAGNVDLLDAADCVKVQADMKAVGIENPRPYRSPVTFCAGSLRTDPVGWCAYGAGAIDHLEAMLFRGFMR